MTRRYAMPGLDAHLSSGNPDDDQAAIDSRIDEIYSDDEAMAEINQRVSELLACGELIGTVADAYGTLKAITDGVQADQLTPGQQDHLVALWRASCRLCDLVRKEVEAEACA